MPQKLLCNTCLVSLFFVFGILSEVKSSFRIYFCDCVFHQRNNLSYRKYISLAYDRFSTSNKGFKLLRERTVQFLKLVFFEICLFASPLEKKSNNKYLKVIHIHIIKIRNVAPTMRKNLQKTLYQLIFCNNTLVFGKCS